MGWFTKFCRQAGLTVHQIVKPVEQTQKREVSRRVEEKKVNEQVTLRRTTIEEIEVRKER